jgi:hypothetical protein
LTEEALAQLMPEDEMDDTLEKRDKKDKLDMSLTQSDIDSLRMRARTSKSKAAKKLDRRGRYMKDILKTSECFEHFFS